MRRWHSEPPQYMLDLYNEVADVNGLTRLPGPYGATVVRAFLEKGLHILHFVCYMNICSHWYTLIFMFTNLAHTLSCYIASNEHFFIIIHPDEGADSVFSFFLTGMKEKEEEVLETEFHVYHSRLPREQRHLLEQNMYMVGWRVSLFMLTMLVTRM